MAVGLSSLDTLAPVPGISIGVACTGLRSDERKDITVLLAEEGSNAACCFTKNKFQAAPVTVARNHLTETSNARVVIINAGNANAGTGEQGIKDALTICKSIANHLSIEASSVLPFSTGVIGQLLPVDQIANASLDALDQLTSNGWVDAAHAIMTTDTIAKGSSKFCQVDGKKVTVTGIAKGSGMICPDMATMLAFVASDIRLPQEDLQQCLDSAVGKSFNRISVDGDTSTNDACLVIATGEAGNSIQISEADRTQFQTALNAVMLDLAHAIVRDGEGATKFVTINVIDAVCDDDAHIIAKTIANSPLVKTALFASDANWGRLLMAVGRAPVSNLNVDNVDLSINGCSILRASAIDSSYSEQKGTHAMQPSEIIIDVNLNMGKGYAQVWTSDLSHEYVRINAEYRS